MPSTATAALPTQLSDVSDLTAFFRGLDPSKTLLDVSAIASASVVPEGMGNHGGLSGAMTRIALTYVDENGAAPKSLRPATIICKSNKDSEASRAQAKAMQLPREAHFLRAVRDLQLLQHRGNGGGDSSSSSLVSRMQRHAPSLVAGLPIVYYAEGSMAEGTKMVLCEDLGVPRTVRTPSGSSSVPVEVTGIQSGWLLGPHSILNRGIEDLDAAVRGKGWRVITDGATAESSSSPLLPIETSDLVTKSFLSAAELHGAFWQKAASLLAEDKESSADGSPAEYLRGAKWFLSTNAEEKSEKAKTTFEEGRALYIGSQQFAHANWAVYEGRVATAASAAAANEEGKKAHTIPASVKALMAVCCPSGEAPPSYERFLEAFSSRPHTLVHGDFHPGNMVVCAAADDGNAADCPYRIALVDWEVVGIGSGPQDIGQYMISHFTAEQFATLALPAVEAYAARLLQVIAESSASSPTSPAEITDADALRLTILREVVVGALGRWAWLLGVMGGMEAITLDAMAYFNGQVDAFMAWATSPAAASALGTPVDVAALAQLVGMCRP